MVADDYAREGLIDKAIAVVSRALKVAPLDEGLRHRAMAFREAKRLEHKREAAIEGLRAGRMSATAADTWILQLPRIWRYLVTSDLVLRLEADQIRQLFASCVIERFRPGTILVEKGSRVAELFIVVSGVLEVRVPGSNAALRTLGSRDILGERALFEQQPWPASYHVTEKLVLLRLDRAGLEAALQGNSDPRGFLLLLREQRNDQQVEALVKSVG
ncbi:MAG: cyclic nucleotide-binding domain-containing protein [Acidobacteriota bacterium]